MKDKLTQWPRLCGVDIVHTHAWRLAGQSSDAVAVSKVSKVMADSGVARNVAPLPSTFPSPPFQRGFGSITSEFFFEINDARR